MEDQQKKIAEYKHYHMCLYQCILPGECSFTDVDWHHCEGSDPPRTSLKSRIAPQNCCTNNNQWKMLIQLCIRSTKVTADEIGWTPIRNFGTMWFIRSRYWFFGPIRYSSPAPHLMNRKGLYDCHNLKICIDNFMRISNFSMGVLHVKVKYWRIFCDVISLLARVFIVSSNRVS